MTRVIHTGDTHVGYRQYNSPERRADFLRAFERVVDDAVDDGVDAVVHAGDLFHDRRPELDDILGVLRSLRRLQAADVPFLAIVGNHEATRGSQWLDLFEQLGLATRLGAEPTVVGDAALYGLDFVPESRRGALDYEFEPVPASAEYAVLVAHGQFDPLSVSIRGDAWDLAAVLEASTVAFDVALLGDEHAHDTVSVDGVPATYCGSTERVSAAEREGRGYNIVTFGDAAGGDAGDDGTARSVDLRRRAIGTRPFVFVSVELADGEGVERVRDRVREHDLADAVVIVEVTGEGEPVTPADVESAALAEGALVARVTDRREVLGDDDAEVPVQFADPDAAVRQRVDELGLSSAAREVDETVRASKIADSNVRETVAGAVRERIDDGDLGEFARAEKARPSEEASLGDAGESADGGGAAGNGDRSPDGTDGEAATAVADADGGVTGDGSGDASASTSPTDGSETDRGPAEEVDGPAEDEHATAEDDEPAGPGTEGGSTPDGDGATGSTDGDGQTSWGDFA